MRLTKKQNEKILDELEGIKKEFIEVPIYWSIDEFALLGNKKNNIIIDEEDMRRVFEDKLEKIVKNPRKFINLNGNER
jgi:hypothetical protein